MVRIPFLCFFSLLLRLILWEPLGTITAKSYLFSKWSICLIKGKLFPIACLLSFHACYIYILYQINIYFRRFHEISAPFKIACIVRLATGSEQPMSVHKRSTASLFCRSLCSEIFLFASRSFETHLSLYKICLVSVNSEL